MLESKKSTQPPLSLVLFSNTHPPHTLVVLAKQALGKSQARDQAEAWGRSKLPTNAHLPSSTPRPITTTITGNKNNNNYNVTRQQNSGVNVGGGGNGGSGGGDRGSEAAERSEKVKVLELRAAMANERRAAAAKDLEISEVCVRVCEMYCSVHAVVVKGNL